MNKVYLIDIPVTIITINFDECFGFMKCANNFLAFLKTTKRLVAKPENPRQLTP
jgi:hypothetical protein